MNGASTMTLVKLLFATALIVLSIRNTEAAELPSWNDGPSKAALIEYVHKVTTKDSPNFVPKSQRIAVFDNDGCLWCERPIYFQLQFAIDQVKKLSAKHPEWKTTQPFQAVLEGDKKTLAESGEKGILKIIAATHAGMTDEEFARQVSEWLKTARHPRFKRPYSECVYQPMLEVLKYLRKNGFKTYIVSGGGIDFMRVFAEEVYGIPPEQVIGSIIKTEYVEREGTPMILRKPEIDFIDDKAGKPVGIQRFIGRRPLMAFGNSDGDYQMLRYVTAGKGARFGMIIHHTDAEREYQYDRQSHIGKLDKALDDAAKYKWNVVDMKKDWKQVFPKR